MKKPRAAPARSSSLFKLRRTRGRNAAMSMAAREKRMARKRKTEAWSRAFLTTTKVVPHRRVQKASARSALARLEFSIGFAGAWLKGRQISRRDYVIQPGLCAPVPRDGDLLLWRSAVGNKMQRRAGQARPTRSLGDLGAGTRNKKRGRPMAFPVFAASR